MASRIGRVADGDQTKEYELASSERRAGEKQSTMRRQKFISVKTEGQTGP